MSPFFSRSKPQTDARLSGSYSDEESGLVDDVKRERKFVRKLDAILVTWAFFAYLMKVSCVHDRKSTSADLPSQDDRRNKLQNGLCVWHERRRTSRPFDHFVGSQR